MTSDPDCPRPAGLRVRLGRFLPLLGLAAGLIAAEPAARPRVAIIMDDGPHPGHAAGYHALFAREGVRITFAHVGRNVDAHPALTQAAAAASHEIVNHSYTHPHFKGFDDASIRKEVGDTQRAVAKAAGRAPQWFWSPFGEWDDRIAAAVRAEGLEHFPAARFNFLDTRDWDRATTEAQVFQRATTGVRGDTIILCHEWPETTFAQMPAIIAELKRLGVEFVTFSELAAGRR